MSQSKDIVVTFLKTLWEERDLSAIDRWVAADCVLHTPMTVNYGRMSLQAIVTKWFEAFPDLIFFWENCVAESNTVVCRWHARGTHLGSFFETKPSNEEISFMGINTFLLREDKIQEYWSLIDIHSILKQAGGYQSLSEIID